MQQQQQQQSKMYTRGALQALADKNMHSMHHIVNKTENRSIPTVMITIVYGLILRPSSNNWASYRRLKWQIPALFL
jgi:hypothetical protein